MPGTRTFLIPTAVLLFASSAPAQKPAGDYLAFVGSYTHPTATTTSASKGIYAFRFDSKGGTLAPLGLAAEAVNPAHLWASPNGKYLYAVSWQSPDKMDTVAAYRIDHKTGMLTLINKVSAKGDLANQVVLDSSGQLAGTVTYASGTFTLYRVEGDGRLSESFYTDQHTGTPLSPRQPGPRAHGIAFSKDSKTIYSAGDTAIHVWDIANRKEARRIEVAPEKKGPGGFDSFGDLADFPEHPGSHRARAAVADFAAADGLGRHGCRPRQRHQR